MHILAYTTTETWTWPIIIWYHTATVFMTPSSFFSLHIWDLYLSSAVSLLPSSNLTSGAACYEVTADNKGKMEDTAAAAVTAAAAL